MEDSRSAGPRRLPAWATCIGVAACLHVPIAFAADESRRRCDMRGCYEVIHDFDSTRQTGGQSPYAFAKTSDGAIYGLTALVADAPDMVGAVYRLHANGRTSIVRLAENRESALLGARQGNVLYGTIMLDDYAYEPRGCGQVRRLNRDGSSQVLHDFSHDSPLGCYLRPHLVEDGEGRLIGATRFEAAGAGAMFRVALDGTASLLHTFGSGPSSEYPVTLADDGSIYAMNQWAIYRIESDGSATLAAMFDQPIHGFIPAGGMIRGSDGAFYGANFVGGPHDGGAVFRFDPATHVITLVHGFDVGRQTISNPDSSLLLASDGHLYGTTGYGIYRVRPDGTAYEELTKFTYPRDGSPSGAPLIEAPNGNLIGARGLGGQYGSGMLYRLRLNAP
ncbi:choice-of-anchor tandem repeat GloVer-containing protein [Ideonella sp. YS5]|uniref:choice-of-anchor tandem repeat GloVer-containing protein n=1 Tax=Ideonella sp. YS5 TaxID=3453714 RepID=UPI003EED009E